jgi:DNA replication protein DnaC
MRRLDELMRQIANSQGGNGQTSANDNNDVAPPGDLPQPQPLNVVCRDPENPDKPCPICKGMGVIKYDVKPDDKRFGKLFRCPNHPVEVDEQRQQRMRRLSNLDAFEDKTFDNFRIDDLDYTDKQISLLRGAFQGSKNFADTMNGWLLLRGNYGTGKTHLAAAVGNARLAKGDMVLFMTTPDLLDYLRSTFASSADAGYDETFERIRDTQLLILDDLGVENPSQWAQEKLFQLLNYRYSHRKPTVITTNVDLDELDPRIRSRLMDKDIIKNFIISAPDYRDRTPNEQQQLLSRLDMYTHMTFDTFNVQNNVTNTEHQILLKAAQAAFEYAHHPANWLMFTGGYGTGKTHLAASIANFRKKRDDDVTFLTVPDLLDHLRNTFSPDSNVTFDKRFNQIRNTPLLILDDMGTESAKPWAQEKLFQIMDYRYVSRMPTVITTVKRLNDMNPRIVSRLIDKRICRTIEIKSRSYAERIKQHR